jgi:hypothetical protein
MIARKTNVNKMTARPHKRNPRHPRRDSRQNRKPRRRRNSRRKKTGLRSSTSSEFIMTGARSQRVPVFLRAFGSHWHSSACSHANFNPIFTLNC